jgi:hypothetical protein
MGDEDKKPETGAAEHINLKVVGAVSPFPNGTFSVDCPGNFFLFGISIHGATLAPERNDSAQELMPIPPLRYLPGFLFSAASWKTAEELRTPIIFIVLYFKEKSGGKKTLVHLH